MTKDKETPSPFFHTPVVLGPQWRRNRAPPKGYEPDEPRPAYRRDRGLGRFKKGRGGDRSPRGRGGRGRYGDDYDEYEYERERGYDDERGRGSRGSRDRPTPRRDRDFDDTNTESSLPTDRESNMEEGGPPYGPGGDEMSEAVCPQRALYRTPDGREARPACG